jgi:hypothetical protein
MSKHRLLIVCLLAGNVPALFAGVTVKTPTNNSTVQGSVNFVASATTSCSKGISAMGIYTAPYQLAYSVNSASLNHSLSLSPGTYSAVIVGWDQCGGASTATVNLTVEGGHAFKNLQSSGGWSGYGQGPPNFVDCSPSPCEGITYWMQQNVASPSPDGRASAFHVGGTSVYSDALFNNHLIGDQSSQGLPDTNHTLVPSLHNFTYDVYFYISDLSASQALEFDVNQFWNNMGFIWGHECRIAGGNEWDVWNNQSSQWTPTGIPCNPNSNSWNHLTIQVERTSGNELLYQSITLNGVTHTLNWTFPPGSAPSDWYGVTVNYQMDGNYEQQSYNVFLDMLTFSYE